MKKQPVLAKSSRKSKPFPIVAIGASAGGLEAVSDLLKNLPRDTGMAYVYIQHLDPTHKSMLADILARTTKMKVQNAKQLLRIEPNNLYIIPPDKNMAIVDGVLKLNLREAKPAINMPIDKFFISLAEKQKEGSIGVILSGNAHDGTLGLKAIKIAGGLTFAQDNSAKFGSMPKSAIADGYVDMILSPKEIAIELGRISKNTGVIEKVMQQRTGENIKDDGLVAIIDLLRKSTGVNFQHYKINTIRRRIIRRMLLHKVETLEDYVNYLKQHPKEIPVLYQDLLINVTSFFRDPDALAYLKETLLPKIIKSKPSSEAIRLWVPACSTGEEAYSLAIILTEILNDMALNVPIQIFATDLSEQAIAKVRVGLYSKNDLVDVSPKRIQRFFTKMDSSFRINKTIRDLCVFATHNVFSDPPFSRLDLISCCNLMIYMDTVLQKKIIATFHYALNNDGYLVLGKSETIGASKPLFSQFEKQYKVYARKNDGSNKARFEMNYRIPESERKDASLGLALQNKNQVREINFEKTIEEILLAKYVPASIVVNKYLDILQLHGQVSFFLELLAGKASLNLLKVARPGLVFELKSTTHKSIKSGKPEKKTGIEIKNNGNTFSVSIEVVPLNEQGEEELFLIVFEKLQITPIEKIKSTPSKDQTVKRLQQELEIAKEDMRSMLEEQEASNEELQSANEEVVSSNEELQSINEELETSKEEVESTNEELMTINSELQVRNAQLSESYEYVEAVFYTVREPMLVLDKDVRVQSANKAFYKIFQVKEEETEGMLIYDLGNREWNIPQLRHLLEEIVSNNNSFDGFEVTHNFPDIGERIILLNARRVVQNAHQKQLILLSFEDITDQRKAQKIMTERTSTELHDKKMMVDELGRAVRERTQELQAMNNELQRSNSELQQFAFVASHDLQEPLRKIMTFIDRIRNRKEEELTKIGKAYFDKIVQSSKRMRNLIDDLLDFSSISFSNKKFIKADLNKILKSGLADLDVIINEKKARIEFDDNLPVIQAVPMQMVQLFYNLITNALKFAKDDIPSIIKISCRMLAPEEINERKTLNSNAPYVVIVFKDNGIGFDPEFAEQIFVIFQRLNDKKQYPGTGIGLALCRKIVDNHKGDIYAQSTKEGAAFHVILPIKQKQNENKEVV